MSIWIILGYALFIAIVMYYWYNPDFFKVKSEKYYKGKGGKHPDPHQYKNFR
jgi:hypothetical protein